MKTDEQKLNIVGAAAQLLLENGSETYRVEETAQRMAKGFGMEQVNIAAFPTSVFLEADGRAYVRRISRRGTNSRRIAMVNEISREVEHGKLSAEQAERALERARSTPGFSQRVLIPAYALAAASFCLLFGGDAATFGVTFAIGVIVQAVQPWFAHIQMGVLLGNFVGGWLTAVLAQMLQIALPVYNVNAAIIGGIMPLLSGLAMTTAVRDTVYGDLVSGMARALEAMLLAADKQNLLLISGTGEVIAPDDGVLAIGSGGNYALAAARAMVRNTELEPKEIVRKALEIASEICVYTNDHISVEEV